MQHITELKREGLSIVAISELTGYDRKTIRKYLLAPSGRPAYGPRPAPPGKLEPFKRYLNERLQAGVWNAQVLLRELRERNCTGGYTLLTDWLRPQREAASAVSVRRFNRATSCSRGVPLGAALRLSRGTAETRARRQTALNCLR